nr:vitronectin-like protein [Physarum polycephalum=slime molds, Peptide Partial, 20 aa] [Physarum polycephalum]
ASYPVPQKLGMPALRPTMSQ